MKKLLSLFVMAMLLSGALGVGNANAGTIFDMNLSNISGNDFGVYEDIFSLGVSGFGNINQSYGVDGFFNDGDKFTEYAIFQHLGFKTSVTSGTSNFTGIGDDKMMFAYAESLSGIATNFNLGKFDYIFDAGSIINIYIGDIMSDLDELKDPAYLSTATKIATLNLMSGAGAGSDAYLGSQETGSTRLLASLDDDSMPGIWFTDALGDLTQLTYPTYFLIDTTNRISSFAEYFDVSGKVLGFNAIASSSGDVYVNPVPEPATMLLLGAGLLGLGIAVRRNKMN